MLKKIFLLLIFSLPMLATAQTAEFHKLWIEFDVYKDGAKGMNIHNNFSVDNMKGIDGKVVVFFYHEDNTPLKDLNGRYCTVNGQVSTSKDIRPNYTNAVYNDLVVFIPYAELHMKPGKHNYKCKAGLWCSPKSQYIAYTGYAPFEGSGGTNSNKVFPEGQSFSYRSNNGTTLFITFRTTETNVKKAIVWINSSETKYYHWDYNTTDALGFNGYDYTPYQKIIGYDNFGNPIKSRINTGEYTTKRNNSYFELAADYQSLVLDRVYYKRVNTNSSYPNSGYYYNGNGNNGYNSGSSSSSQSSSTYQTCPECHGTGYCTLCKGRGYTFNNYSGHDDKCPRCFGNGRCYMCHGTGRM